MYATFPRLFTPVVVYMYKFPFLGLVHSLGAKTFITLGKKNCEVVQQWGGEARKQGETQKAQTKTNPYIMN